MTQFVRYLGVQLVAYGFDMGGFVVALKLIGDLPLLANICGKLLAGGFAFVAHRSFTFRLAPEQHDAGQAARYFLLLALNLPISTFALSIVLRARPPETLAKFIADAAIVALTYWLSKRFVFLAARPAAPTEEPR